jgi:hypothetical protein
MNIPKMSRRIGPLCTLFLLLPALAMAQESDAGANLPAIKPPAQLPAVKPTVPLPAPDTTKSADEPIPSEKVEPRYEPTEADYQEDGKSGQSGQVPGRYPMGNRDARPDDVRIVRILPRDGHVASVAPGGGGPAWTAENSIHVLLEYDLNTVPRAVVAAGLDAPIGVQSSYQRTEGSPWVDRGSGRMEKRFAISCAPDSPERLRNLRLRYWMTVSTSGGATRLVEKEQALPHTILCRNAGITAVSQPPAARADDIVRRLEACPDPAAGDLSARLVGRTDPSRGVGIIEIVGVVRNVGRAAYVSEPRQQSVELIEEQPGTPPRVVEDRTFTILAPNGTVRLVHRRGWDTATEFQPRYRLRIVYEPDIRTDANPRNDDCRLSNNDAVLEPGRINALFR